MTIDNIRHWARLLAILDNSSSTEVERREACREVFSGDPTFWDQVADMVASQSKPELAGPVAMASTKAAPTMPAEEPARVVQMKEPPPKKVAAKTTSKPNGRIKAEGTLAEQLRKPAAELGLKTRSLIEQFRDALSEKGRGADYWHSCRDLTLEVLEKGMIQEVSDWKLLIAKIKWNIFFTDRQTTELFVGECPREDLTDLLQAEDGLWRQVEMIRQETNFNQNSPFRLNFIMQCCLAVGGGAKGLLENCKHAVNRMKQRDFISSKHWLVQEVGKISRPKKIKSEELPKVAADDRKADQVQEIAEAVVEESNVSLIEEQAVEAPDPDNDEDKPDQLDSAFKRSFEKQMLEGEIDPDSVPLDELERLTAPEEIVEDADETEVIGIPPAPMIDVGVPAETIN